MCRIFGAFNAATSDASLRTVAELLRHGGPDAQTFAAGPDWALGNTRLAIVDLDGGAQPFTLGDVTVVYNGEIYNHDELRERLRAAGYTFADRCDGSILPALYLHYGDAFAEHLDGMFSVAVMDRRGEPRLVLAVDDAGMKPLYYFWDPAARRIRFASELPALLAFPDVPAHELELGLDAYLVSKTGFGEQTMFEGIRVLPPAATVAVSASTGFTVRARAAAHAEVPRARESFADLAAELREVLRAEVRRLLVADVPVAAITSGGLDSSLVTALAAEAQAELHSFNIAYTGNWPSDERGFAAEVARACGTTHHQVVIDPASFPELLGDVVWHLGQPNADPITLSTFALFRAVRDAGFKVALTGDAADELFGGYSRMTAAVNSGPGPEWIGHYEDHLSAVPRALRHSLYTDDFAAAVRRGEPALPAGLSTELAGGRDSRLRRICTAEQRYRLPAYHLRRVDHLSMASSVEVRLTFCQPSVMKLAASLAQEHMITADGVKRLLYAAADGLVPASVLNRPKQPFTLPITAMLAPGSALWSLARECLSTDALRADGRLRPDAVGALFDRQAARASDDDALAIWSLTIHQLWRERFFGGARRQFALSGAAS